MTDYKLDLFNEILPAIDRHDYGFLGRQDAESRKSFAPLVVLRAASALKNASSDLNGLNLMMLNARANLDLFDLSDHPDLQWRLLASCGLGRRTSHEWIPMPPRGRSSGPLHAFLGHYWPEASRVEIDLLIRGFTRLTFEAFVRSCGLAPPAEKEAMDVYDRFHGTKVKAKKAASGGGKKKAKR